MHTLSMILLACLVGGLISMAAAATVVFRLSQRATAILVAFAFPSGGEEQRYDQLHVQQLTGMRVRSSWD